MHEETYGDAEWEDYQSECVYYDSEGDRIVTETYEDWAKGRLAEGLRPYRNAAGEVDYWRLELTLNELGRAVLVIDRFGNEGGRLLT